MSTRYLTTGTLVQEQPFRRLFVWSLMVHLLAIGFSVVAPVMRRAPLLPAPIFVDLVAAPKPAAAARLAIYEFSATGRIRLRILGKLLRLCPGFPTSQLHPRPSR